MYLMIQWHFLSCVVAYEGYFSKQNLKIFEIFEILSSWWHLQWKLQIVFTSSEIFLNTVFFFPIPSSHENMCFTCKISKNSAFSSNCYNISSYCNNFILSTTYYILTLNRQQKEAFNFFFLFFSSYFYFVSHDTSICLDRNGTSKKEIKTNTTSFFLGRIKWNYFL